MKSIRCPHCNMRLFDVNEHDKASIAIKCKRCGKIITIEIDEEKRIDNKIITIS